MSNLALALGNTDSANSILLSWESAYPDDDRVKIWKGRIRGEGLLGRLRRKLSGRAARR